ncbi:RNA-binding domain-containing protein [Ignicoccus hospitalis]|uniref:Exosome subunit n=1 Tax=Ignicoccus hospitalis (strain KIN4/I / DSM 18386 / JCM 14125) TaxID=453591 RepID=A8A922_IGNH4|nr:RNA-binding domain-containing protein [Ignicoccus hospitalis]ABU81424.1 Protein of unknown function DUF54 [Ignicoccus hospitalis KIN4/I]HIH90269.1 hypothetical protein [Desulfurococcaceae archaeon]
MIERVEVTVIIHATEDPEKVMESVFNLLGLNKEDVDEVETLRSRGHHGNPITYVKMVIKGKKAQKALRNIISRMDELEYQILKREMDLRTEGSKLYLRFDKQRAYLNEVSLSTGSDVVRVVAVFKGRVDEGALEKFRRADSAGR